MWYGLEISLVTYKPSSQYSGGNVSYSESRQWLAAPWARTGEDIYHILYTGRLQGRKQAVGDVLLHPWARTVEDIYHILYTGRLQGRKQAVGDVLLPPWANSVDDFIRQHRNALGKAANLR